MAEIIRYVDPVNGDDSNTGDTPGNAKKTFLAAMSIVNRSSDTKIIRIRGGHRYVVLTGSPWPGSFSGYNVTIEVYWLAGDEPSNPILDGVTYLAKNSKGWVLEGAATKGGYVWSKQLGISQIVKRVWSNTQNNGVKRSQCTFGEALRRAPDANLPALGITATEQNVPSILAHLSKDDTWFGADTNLGFKLYMWSEFNNVDPSEYFNGLGIAQSGTGTNGIGTAFSIYNSKNFTIKNIDVMAATAFPFAVATADTDPAVEDVLFYRCGSYGSVQSFKITQAATSAYLTAIRRVTVRECFADPMTSAREQEPNLAYGLLSGADQYDIRGAVDQVQIVDCVGVNPTHSAMSIGSKDSAQALPKRSGYLRHTVVCADWCTYSRSIDSSLCDASCYITNCRIYGTNVVAQLAGSIRVTSNKFFGLRKAIRKPSTPDQSTDGWVAINCYRADLGNTNVGNDRWFDTKPTGVLFANNSCDGCYGTPVEVLIFNNSNGATEKPLTSLVDNSFQFYNNVLLDTVPERAGKPYVTTFQNGSLTVGVQSFRNNVIYCGEGVVPTVKWQGSTYTIFNAPGHIGNLNVNPMVDDSLKPLPGSPLAKAGTYCGVVRDYTGKRFGLKPAIGAYEIDVTPVRKPRTT